jgi:hypothetical protein
MFGGRGRTLSSGKGRGLAGRPLVLPRELTSFNINVPPSWGDNNALGYSYDCWVKDLLTWSCATDVHPTKQAHAAILRLTGTARDLAQDYDPTAFSHGAFIDYGDGQGPEFHSGLELLVQLLDEHYGPVNDEPKFDSVLGIMKFEREPGETIDDALVRFDILSDRASVEADFDLSFPGKAFWLLHSCKVPVTAWTNLFMQAQTTNSLFPTTEDEFTRLKDILRMNSHMQESGPHNPVEMASRGHSHQGATYAVSMYEHSSAPVGAESSYYATDRTSYAYPTDWSSANQTPTTCAQCNSAEAYSFYEDYEDDTATESEDEMPSWETEFAGLIQQHGFLKLQNDITDAYITARLRWRRFTRRSTRRRRFNTRKYVRHSHNKRYSIPRFMCASCSTKADIELVAFAGKGSKSRRGFPPRQNPIGADGQVMKCSICESTTHLRRFCTTRTKLFHRFSL